MKVFAVLNFVMAIAFSVKALFVTPTPASIYYGVVSWICGFGFWSVAELAKIRRKEKHG